MRSKKLLALAIAGATFIGSMASAVPAKAEVNTNTTTVTLMVEKESTYDIVIPAKIEVKNAGLNESSITIKNFKQGSGNTINYFDMTVRSQNNWYLKSGDKSMPYRIITNQEEVGYYDKYKDDIFTMNDNLFFCEIEELGGGYVTDENSPICTEEGGTSTFYVAVPNYSDYDAGEYSDVITWTLEIH